MLFTIVLVYFPTVIVCSPVPSTDVTSTPSETIQNGRSGINDAPIKTTPTPIDDFHGKLVEAKKEHANQPWYVAGFEAAKAILLPVIHDTKKDLAEAREVELAIQPRTLIDDIEDCFVERYNKEFKKNESLVKAEQRKLNNHIQNLVGRIKNIDDKLNASDNLNLTTEQIDNYYEERTNFTILIENREKEKEVVQHKYLGNYQHHEDPKQKIIANRDHRLYWILKTQTDKEGKIKSINRWIEKRYREKCQEDNNFKATNTLDDFTQIFTLSLSKAHDRASRAVVHATRKLAISDDCEFEMIPFFGNDWDEHLTILVNAVGTCKFTSPLQAGMTFKTRKTTPWETIPTEKMTPAINNNE